MTYLYYIIALLIGLIYPIFLAASAAGSPISGIWDTVSFLMTIAGSYFLVAAAAGSLSFFDNNKHLKMWGNLCLAMGFIGAAIGFIFIFRGMAPGVDPLAKLFASMAVAIITVLYGLIFKYVVISVWLGCRENQENKS